MISHRTSTLAFVIGAAMVGAGAEAQPVIRSVGTLGGSASYGNAMSADGSVVVGSSSLGNGTIRAFRWTSSGGVREIGGLAPGMNSYATCVSGDGRVVGGFAPADEARIHAFRWTADGMEDCGTLGGKDSLALGLNGDGTMVVGIASLATGARGHAFRWTVGQPVLDIGALGGQESKCYGISADGTALAGITDIAGSSQTRAFRWTSVDGMVELGTLGGANSRAFAISAGGNAIVGYSDTGVSGPGGSGGGRAFRWTASGGMQNLGSLGGAASAAYAVSADGSVVGGYDSVPYTGASHAFVWSAATGMVDLNVYLPTVGCDLTGWTLYGVNGMSADGTAVTGNGLHNGQSRGFVVTGLGTTMCRADFDHSGMVTPQDIFAFLNVWFAGAEGADFDGSGGVSEWDVHAFLNAWFAGCA